MPAPKVIFDSEWVELYNAGTAFTDVSGWQLDDGVGGAQPFTLTEGEGIAPGDVLLITFDRALFNNSGDDVRLLRPDGTVADSFSYPSSQLDQSYSYDLATGGWTDTLSPSPGQLNQATDLSSLPGEQINALPVEPYGVINDAGSAGESATVQRVFVQAAASPVVAPNDSFALRQPETLRTGVAPAAEPYQGNELGQIYRYNPPVTATPLLLATPLLSPQADAIAASAPKDDDADWIILGAVILLALGGGLLGLDRWYQRDKQPVL
ncbi:MAG: lamin tail domain-containing protein [Chloroflexales bacterium]|nr:lamin tail domain-containing protein [Chloroflexales bacterium]